MPGRSTSGFDQPGRHCLHQARSAVRCSAESLASPLCRDGARRVLTDQEGVAEVVTLGGSLLGPFFGSGSGSLTRAIPLFLSGLWLSCIPFFGDMDPRWNGKLRCAKKKRLTLFCQCRTESSAFVYTVLWRYGCAMEWQAALRQKKKLNAVLSVKYRVFSFRVHLFLAIWIRDGMASCAAPKKKSLTLFCQ